MSQAEPSQDCPLRLHELRRLHFGECDADERARLEAVVAEHPACRARLDALAAGEAAFLERADVGSESAAILARLEATETRPASWTERLRVRWLAPLAAAAALAVALPVAMDSGPASTTRTKGSPALEMYVKDAAGPRRGHDGIVLTEGDAIQFRYRAAGRSHLFVLSVDSRGVISPLYPADSSASLPIRPDGTHTLEGSVILDDAVGPERVYAVFSDRPLAFDELEAAALDGLETRDAATLRRLLPERDDVYEISLLIVKE